MMRRSIILVALCFICVDAASINTNADITDGAGWHIHVTMHVYSGRLDPSWIIQENHPAYGAILGNFDGSQARPLPSKLGYKGFSLVHVPPYGSVVNGGHQNWTVTSYPDLEMFLLRTTDSLHIDIIQHARESILQPVSQRKRRSLYNGLGNYGSYFGLPTTEDPLLRLSNADMYELAKLWGLDKRFRNITTTPQPIGPTKYDPEKWDTYFVEVHNNCYNYANNRITNTFAQPGRAGNCVMPTEIRHGSIIEKLAKCDGLQAIPAPDLSKLPRHDWNLVALVFWPPKPGSDLFDFHWYRLDGNGRWSHKPGKTDATNLDEDENFITDPRHANRGHYTEFVGFMQTRPDEVILI